MTEPSKAVFLSYASQDAEAAKRICDALRSAGIEVWFDQSELRGGEAWDQMIRRQIHDCALFMPIISSHSDGRAEGYFRLEWKLAVDRSHLMADDVTFLLPVVIDDTAEAAARVPDKFRSVQWSRLPAGTSARAIVERLSRLLSPGQAPPAPLGPPVGAVAVPLRSTPRTPSRWGRAAVLLITTAAVIGVGYVAAHMFRPSKRAAVPLPAPVAQSALQVQSAIPEKSVAVLPFADMSEKKDQEYFSDGMAEEIIDLLTKLPQLKVIGRTSSFQFKGRNEDLRSIGEKLGVAYLLEGSVRKAANRIRVTAQLIDARSGAHVWSEVYDRDFGDVLSLQDQIAARIVFALQGAVGAEDAQPLRRLQNPEAYTLYLRARAGLALGSEEGLNQALANAERALALDPTFAQAAEILAWVRGSQIAFGLVPPLEGWPLAKAATERVLTIEPDSIVGRIGHAAVLAQYDYDWAGADKELAKAMASNPGNALSLVQIARLAFGRGSYDVAKKYSAAALSLDPLDALVFQVDGWMRYLRGDLVGAEGAIRRSIELSPTFLQNHFALGAILLARGQLEAALKEMGTEALEGGRDTGLAVVYYALGRRAESDAALARTLHEFGVSAPADMATVYAYRHERDRAFEWLDRAVAVRDPNLIWVRDDPLYRSLHDDARWKAFLRKMNLQE